MATPRIAVKVELDAKQAEAGFARIEKLAKNSFTEINSGLAIAGKAFSAVSGVIGEVADAVGRWTKAASASELAQTKLAAVAGKHLGELQKLNSELQRKLGIDDDELAKLQTKLLVLGVLPSKLEDATKATLGLSTATGKDMTRSAIAVAKAFAKGNEEAGRLRDMFVVAEAAARTWDGTLKKLAVNFGELEETLGGVIIKSPPLLDFLDDVAVSIGLIGSKLDQGRPKLESWFDNAFVRVRRFGESMVRVLDTTADHAQVALKIFMPGLSYGARALGAAVLQLGEPDPDDDGGASIERFLRGKATTGGKTLDPGARGGKWTGKRKKKVGMSLEAESIIEAARLNNEAQMDALEKSLDAQKAFQKADQKLADLQLKQTIRNNKERLRADRVAADAREALKQQELKSTYDFTHLLSEIGARGVGEFVASITQNLINGSLDAEAAAGKFLGGVLSQIGEALIALGTAAVVAGLLGMVAPIFAGATGGPAGIGAGFALVAAGGVLAGIGGALSSATSGSSGGGGFAATPPRVADTPFPRSAEPAGFTALGREQQTTVINIPIGRGFLYGTPRQLGTQILELVEEADTLRPGRRRR